MDLTTLHEFAVLAERLNYAQAARELNMSQSTLSRHMSALESELGCALFTHSGRTSLTYAGQILLEETGALFAVESRLERRLSDAKRSVQGKVRLEDYFFSREIKNFMLTAARRYRAVYPGVSFEYVSISSGTTIENLLESGDLDVGVLVHTGPERPSFSEGERRVVPLWHRRSRMGIYVRREELRSAEVFAGENGSEVALGVLRRLPVILPLRPEYANFRSDLNALCAAHGFQPSFKLVEMASLEDLALIDMVGCAQIALVTDVEYPGSPFKLDPDCVFYPIHEVCWGTPYLVLPDRDGDAVIDSFADFLRELAEEHLASDAQG